MQPASFIRLFSLAAIWGSSFLFMRIAVGTLGPAALMTGRVVFAALFLGLMGWLLKKHQLDLKNNWKHFFILGFFNSALPFLLFAYAAQSLTASVLSVLNATAPIWGALIGIVIFRQALTLRIATGLVLGISGVAILVGFDPVVLEPGALIAVFCAAGAAFCYGIATHYTRLAKTVAPYTNAHGSMWTSTLMLAPVMLLFPVQAEISLHVALAVLALGVICTGVAYLLYFRLVQDEGATPALTVTFLIPVFGVFWGHVFLNEALGWHTFVGVAVVITGTSLVTGFKPSALFRVKA
ncbi:DMT family transporter [Rheinheimera soli]|uniref:DMT family transporter n=1 Tax=Rheinheimera soli TaxID=443616 RepID=UPI001E618DD6|nr:DMT family transporter [Rheinheimera soli]